MKKSDLYTDNCHSDQSLWASIKTIAFAVLIALIFRSVIASPYKIPTGSMIPTLLIGDFIFVSKLAYGIKIPFTNKNLWPLAKPKRGDVIVFVYPENQKLDYIKRVVALAGDVVEVRDSVLFVNQLAVPRSSVVTQTFLQDYRSAHLFKETVNDHNYMVMEAGLVDYMDFGPYTIPAEHVFVMGDNRDNSQDSRYWGPLPLHMVRGKAMFIWLSLNSANPLARLAGWTIPNLRLERFGMQIH